MIDPTESLGPIIVEYASLIGVTLLVGLGAWRSSSRAKAAKKALKKLENTIQSGMHEPISLHPEINPALCAGCGACTNACPEGDILKMIDHKAVLVTPTKCVGHGECEAACPTNAITLVFGTKTRGMEIPRISSDFESNVRGVYVAGELGGMGLIRNAFKQGQMAVRHAARTLQGGKKTDVDILVVGAGPAGLAATLTAIAEKKRYLLIDQSTFGGTIANFPRQKLVMSYPAELPIVGVMKFRSNRVSKEELLDYWARVRKATGMQIRERCRFEDLTQGPDGVFTVQTTTGDIRCQKVVLCLGVRSSPRRLGVPGEELTKVTYNLLDPEQYQRKNVTVVGGGNAGAEAGQYLGRPQYGNKVTMLIQGGGFDRCNDENKEIILRMEEAGQVEIWYHSKVTEVQGDKLIVEREGQVVELPNDFLFIFAGAEVPFKKLMGFGIEIDKKFGEALKSS